MNIPATSIPLDSHTGLLTMLGALAVWLAKHAVAMGQAIQKYHDLEQRVSRLERKQR